MDNDGDDDAVAADGSGTLRTFFQRGMDTSSPSGIFDELTDPRDDPFAGISESSFIMPTLADLDDDGDVDLLTASVQVLETAVNGNVEALSSTVRFFRRYGGISPGGRPKFQEVSWRSIDAGDRAAPSFGDLDSDSKCLSVNGTDLGKVDEVSCADADGKWTAGDADLVIGTKEGKLLFYEAEGTNGFTEKTGSASPIPADLSLQGPLSPAVFDVDNDLLLDVVVGDRDGRVSWLRQGSDGKLTKVADDANPFFQLHKEGSDNPDVGRMTWVNVATGDWDGDGDTDFATGSMSDSAWELASRGGVLQPNTFGKIQFHRNMLEPYYRSAGVTHVRLIVLICISVCC